jgi:SAM-dependent methyltransferase
MISMGSIQSLVVRRNAAPAHRTVLIVLMVQLLGLQCAWTQELPETHIKEELIKQERIYRSNDVVPRGYVTNRGLSAYAELLPTGFCDALGKLGSSDRWLDVGAGSGQAILDYYAPKDDDPAGKKCAGAGAKGRTVAISIEDRRTDQWQKLAASLGDERIRYLAGKRLSQYSLEELGKFRIITDVFGGFTYTENLSRFLDNVLSLLQVGGEFYTLMPGVKLEYGSQKLGILYLTELEDAIGRPEKVCSWLKKTTCTEISCESKSDWKRPTEVIKVRKVCSDTSVPRMKLVEFEAGYPPSRRFALDP